MAGQGSGRLDGDLDALKQELREREEQAGSLAVIEQAKGMLLQDFGVSDDEAAEVLITISQETGTPVSEVADLMVQTLTGSASVPTSRATAETLGQLTCELAEDSPAEVASELGQVDPRAGEDLRSQIVAAMRRIQRHQGHALD